MKRVLIIIGKLYIGGAERVGRDIGFFADPEKYEIHYLVFGDDRGAYEAELEEKGCVIHHVQSPSSNQLAYFRTLMGLIRTYRFDVIHSHTMFSSGWATAAGWLLGVKTRIAHSHTIRGPEKRGFVKNLYENTMRRIVLLTATDLVACGKGAGDWFYGSEVFAKRGKLIYNGIGLGEFLFSQAARDWIRRENHLEDSFVIGHVGHLAAVKNQKFLLHLLPEILNRKPNAKLLLLGDGPDRGILEQEIQTLGLEKQVILTGNVSNVGEFMSAMDVFVFPSLYEGMPLAMVEAQTNGLPCCTSDRIPGDVHLTDLIHVLPLEEKDAWVEQICAAKRSDSCRYGKKMMDMGFDTSGMLEKIYALYEG